MEELRAVTMPWSTLPVETPKLELLYIQFVGFFVCLIKEKQTWPFSTSPHSCELQIQREGGVDGNDSQERNSLRYLNKWEPSSFALPLGVWLLNKLADESGCVCVLVQKCVCIHGLGVAGCKPQRWAVLGAALLAI